MIGVLLLSYGRPTNFNDLERYYTDIHNGKRPDARHMDMVLNKYKHYGRCHPLAANSERIAQALQMQCLSSFEEEIRVKTAYKHGSPFIEEAVQHLLDEGVREIWTFPISPLSSKTGTTWYQKNVERSCRNNPVAVHHIKDWYMDREVIQSMKVRLKQAINWIPRQLDYTVIFTAHSQPGQSHNHERYVDQFSHFAEMIANSATIPYWRTAYRSMMNDQWLGPDFRTIMDEEAKKGTEAVVVMDLLSLIENMEVITDIDEEGRKHAQKTNLHFLRTEFLNDSFDFVKALYQIIERTLKQKRKMSVGPR